MADFRVDVGFFRHVKTKKLKRMLGIEGVMLLQMLWAYAAENKHDGEHIYSIEDIELAVDWDGENGAFGISLEEIGFIDRVENGYVLHEWEDHNGFAATANTRSEKARVAANARWGNGKNKEKKGVSDICSADAGANVEHDAHSTGEHMQHDASSNAPSPSPSPSPSHENTLCDATGEDAGSGSAPMRGAASKRPGVKAFEKFWDAFGDKRGKDPAWRAWKRIRGLDDDLVETITFAAERYCEQRASILDRGGTPKMAQGWLSDRRWEDEVGTPVGAAANPMLQNAFSNVLGGGYEQASA